MKKTVDLEEKDTLSKYGQGFQTKVVAALLNDIRFLGNVSTIASPKYFDSEANKWLVETIIDYYFDYKKIPTMDVFKVHISKIKNDTLKKTIVDQLRNVYTKIGTTDFEYIQNEFTEFCKNQNLKRAIYKSIDYLQIGEYDNIKAIIDTALRVEGEGDIGHDYLQGFDERTEEVNRNTVPTAWLPINDLMDGGLAPGELGVIVAPSGVGKTWALCHIGAAAVKQGKKVVHYSLELSEHYVGGRYDTVFTNIPSTNIKDESDKVKKILENLTGDLMIKYFPPKGISARDIELHLDKLRATGYIPDLVIIDYADLLLSKNLKVDSTYQEQGSVYIDLRGMGGELGFPIWTASQTNRSAIDSEVIEADKIADSYAKVMNADFIMSWSRKAKDKLNNTARTHIMKNRFGPDGLTFPCKMNTNTGFIEVFSPNSDIGKTVQKEAKNGEIMERKLLHKKYVETSSELG